MTETSPLSSRSNFCRLDRHNLHRLTGILTDIHFTTRADVKDWSKRRNQQMYANVTSIDSLSTNA